MPRKPKKQPAQAESPKSFDEFADDGDGIEEDVASPDPDAPSNAKSRDWRDIEKLKEERALRRLIDDDFELG